MFDLGATELLLIVVVAVLVIGPKDMPLAFRTAGRWIGKMRKLSSHFRTGLDAMVREAELEDMEKQWKAQNEKIMREHPDGAPPEMEPTGAYPPRQLSDEQKAKLATMTPEERIAAKEAAAAEEDAARAAKAEAAAPASKPEATPDASPAAKDDTAPELPLDPPAKEG